MKIGATSLTFFSIIIYLNSRRLKETFITRPAMLDLKLRRLGS